MANDESIGILGSGAAGLITAYTLIQDGFENVTILTKDVSPGGVWSNERIYPGLFINNVHGEFRFSSLKMPPAEGTGGRLSGLDMCAYMRSFADIFLQDKIHYGMNVKKIYRPSDGKGWLVDVEAVKNGAAKTLHFARFVLCTGGCHTPSIPRSLSLDSAEREGFRGRVFHSSQFRSELDAIKNGGGDEKTLGRTLVIGGGKSAQDISSYLARKGCHTSMVFETTDAVLAVSRPLPGFIRKSRFLGILAGHEHLATRLERFLHTTWLGAKLTHFIWSKIGESSYNALRIPQDSPLRNAHSMFWSIRTNDEGIPRPDSFYSLVNTGKIKLVAPARAQSFGKDGVSIALADGRTLPADTVILCTGYSSSWNSIFDEQTRVELGLDYQAPPPYSVTKWQWKYTTLANPPKAHPERDQWASSIHRGIVPSKNILKYDFAINGAVFTTNNGYSFEVISHWISSYFLQDPHLKLPKTPEEAQELSEKNAAWMRRRYPDALLWANQSYSSSLAFWTWPQAMDDLLRDMDLRTMRSAGNWLTWPFKVIDLSEISTLGAERRLRLIADNDKTPARVEQPYGL